MVIVDTHRIAKVAIKLLCQVLNDHDLSADNHETSRIQQIRHHKNFVTRNEEASKSNTLGKIHKSDLSAP